MSERVNPWDTYFSRMNVSGSTKREAALRRAKHRMAKRMPEKLAYRPGTTINGIPMGLTVLDSDDYNLKTIITMPGEVIPEHGYMEWANYHWLISRRDASAELYHQADVRRCNHLLKWISDSGEIIERWCIVEDGTKYLTGEYTDNKFIVTRGDTRVSLILPRDEDTVKLNRRNRFLIDDAGSTVVLAYELTKPFKLGGAYGDESVICFILQECNSEDVDNFDLRIANYYDYFPREESSTPSPETRPSDETKVTEDTTKPSKPNDGRWF